VVRPGLLRGMDCVESTAKNPRALIRSVHKDAASTLSSFPLLLGEYEAGPLADAAVKRMLSVDSYVFVIGLDWYGKVLGLSTM
jgi:hypothetical protein